MIRFLTLTIFALLFSTSSSAGVFVLEERDSVLRHDLQSSIDVTDFESENGRGVIQRGIGGSMMEITVPNDGSMVFACSTESCRAFNMSCEIEACVRWSIELLLYMENVFRPV